MAFPKRGATLTGTLSASLLAISLIAGCSDPSSDAGDKAASSTQPSAEAPDDSGKQEGAASSGQTRGGDGPEITLNALTEGDMGEASLAGELGCSFTTADGEVLLIEPAERGIEEALSNLTLEEDAQSQRLVGVVAAVRGDCLQVDVPHGSRRKVRAHIR